MRFRASFLAPQTDVVVDISVFVPEHWYEVTPRFRIW